METGVAVAINQEDPIDNYHSPETKYFKSREELDVAVGKDFIHHANLVTEKGERFLVGLSHGQSPAGAYQYILDHYNEINHPDLIRYSFVNSPLKGQRRLKDTFDARAFLKRLVELGLLEKENVLGSNIKRDDMEFYLEEFNSRFKKYLKDYKKEASDYVFLATNSKGHVAGISRNSEAFKSKKIATIVFDRREKELTVTPYFLKKTKRIAFLATKSDKRRALVWLLYRNNQPNESPGFLRHMEEVENRMTVFVNDDALTWPQVEIVRETRFGPSTIKVDISKPYNENAKRKLPVVLLIHGFLGLNSYDGILAMHPSSKFIAAAMHYGSIPDPLPVERYSKHVVNNIDAVVDYFGSRGHRVYLFDHSMGNIYFLMIQRDINRLKGIQKHLYGRIGANPFFGIESKHAILGFLDNVIIPALKKGNYTIAKTLFKGLRRVVPFDSKVGVRKRSINLTHYFVGKGAAKHQKVWKSVKERIIYLMTNMNSLPPLNRIPMERALNRLPPKLFIIQIYAALFESQTFDDLASLPKLNIPIQILKSERDSIAKFDPRLYPDQTTEIIDITDKRETDLFREHLFHMVHPEHAIQIIDDFISASEAQKAE